MSSLYVTADKVGQQNHGAGSVTGNELKALTKFSGSTVVYDRSSGLFDNLIGDEPWKWDDKLSSNLFGYKPEGLAHFYAGTFTKTIEKLKSQGCKITYTAAAHNIEISKREHERMGLAFNYPHLTDPELWKRYVGGYLNADVIICPSQLSADVMHSYGAGFKTGKARVCTIPHGIEIPIDISREQPKTFTVGYLGNCCAPDKGVRYLLEAWKKLNYKDAVLLIGGHDSTSPFFMEMVRMFGGGNIRCLGWIDDVADFYKMLSVYIQPSCSEGWGCEVLEAMSYGIPVLVSDGAGAVDVVEESYGLQLGVIPFHSANDNSIAGMIDHIRKQNLLEMGQAVREISKRYSWDIIRQRYVDLWRSL